MVAGRSVACAPQSQHAEFRHDPPPPMLGCAPLRPRTCTMLGWVSAVLMAASMMAIFSRLAAPLMPAGRMMVLTATSLPRHRPRKTWPNCEGGRVKEEGSGRGVLSKAAGSRRRKGGGAAGAKTGAQQSPEGEGDSTAPVADRKPSRLQRRT